MSTTSLQQLLEIARTDTALRLALNGVTNDDELRAISEQYQIPLSDFDMQQWLDSNSSHGKLEDPEFLMHLSRGLSAADNGAEDPLLSDEVLESICGGQAGEAILGEAG